MIVSALKTQLESFRSQVVQYRSLWGDSLEEPLPDYPVKNFEALEELSDTLLRQLGRLRPYLEALHGAWTLEAYGRSWNVLDHAFGNHAASLKGPSLNAVIDGVQILLGRLDDYAPEAEFRTGAVTTKSADIELTEVVCSRFKRAARSLLTRRAGKSAFEIKDEYDGQDLLHAMLRCYFKYPVRENPLSKIAGSASTRADLCIDELGLIRSEVCKRSARSAEDREGNFGGPRVLYYLGTTEVPVFRRSQFGGLRKRGVARAILEAAGYKREAFSGQNH